jgi:copper chaperone CopZ
VTRKKAPAAKKKAPPKAPSSPTRITTAAQALPEPPSRPASGPRLSPAECGIRVVHVLPGRIRFRVYSLKYNAAFAQEVERKLAAITGVTGVEASPSTGSVLMHYRSKELLSEPLREALETWFPRLDTDSLLASLPA